MRNIFDNIFDIIFRINKFIISVYRKEFYIKYLRTKIIE